MDTLKIDAIKHYLDHVEKYLSTLIIQSKETKLIIDYIVDCPHYFQIVVVNNDDENVYFINTFENQKLVLEYIKRYMTRNDIVKIICKILL